MRRVITTWNGLVFGKRPSDYGIKNGMLDYRTLAELVGDMVLNNEIVNLTWGKLGEWDVVNGWSDEDETSEIFQYYIITPSGADFLKEYTDEIVLYNDKLGMYVWGITHYGTSWDYVLTGIELEGMG